jgi:hypothetical protein
MKKEEFPTFLNEQPTIVFGRNARELLVIVCGSSVGYLIWTSMGSLPGAGWQVVRIALVALAVLFALIVALVPIASRPMEEWFFAWLVYHSMPKLYLYQPLSEEYESIALEREGDGPQQSRASDMTDTFDEE